MIGVCNIMYVVGKESNGVLSDVHETVVTLKHTTTESSIIATRSVLEC